MKKINGILKLNFNKSLKIVSLLILGCTLFSFVYLTPPPPDPPGLPVNHYSLGLLNEPLPILVEDYSERIKVINNTDCSFDFTPFVTDNLYNTVEMTGLYVMPFNNISILNNHLATVLGITSGSLTHVSFTFKGVSTLYDKDFIPASQYGLGWTLWYTNKGEPCQCVMVKCSSLNPITIEIRPHNPSTDPACTH